MVECVYRGRIVARRMKGTESILISACEEVGRCVDTLEQQTAINASSVSACEGCTLASLVRVERPHKAALPILRPVKEPSKEPVGTNLKAILAECGISYPNCGECAAWVEQMNDWGIDGCTQNRPAILNRLTEASREGKKRTWFLNMAKVAAGRYFTVGALLDEAIRRTAAKLSSE